MKFRRFFVLAAPLALAGCVATQQDMLQMQSQMDDLNTNLSTMQKNQADLAVKMDGLSSNLNSFSEQIRDVSDVMTKLSARIDELESLINRKVNAIGQTIKKGQDEVEAALLPAKIYNDAYAAFLNNSHESAISGFRGYLSKFPGGDMAEPAYFYMGESFYLKERWAEAALAYANVLEKFPKSQRVPQARLKYAMSILKLPEDKKAEAVKYLESLVRDFPKSPEAKAAADTLAKLKAKAPAPKPEAKPAAKPAAAPAPKTVPPAKKN